MMKVICEHCEEDFGKLSKLIEDYHRDNYDIGKPYCIECNAEVDKMRRINENKKDNKNSI